MDDVEIRLLTLADKGHVEKFFKEDFCVREPIFGHTKQPPKEGWKFYESSMEAALKAEISYGAFDTKTGEMCAYSMNLLGNAEIPSVDLEPYPLPVKQCYRLLKQTYPNGMDTDVGTQNYLEIFFLGVSDGYGKRGIATQLCSKGVERARQLGCEYVTIDCTSAYSRKAVENLGFYCIREVPYEEYVDAYTDQKAFEGMRKPHYASTLLALKL